MLENVWDDVLVLVLESWVLFFHFYFFDVHALVKLVVLNLHVHARSIVLI